MKKLLIILLFNLYIAQLAYASFSLVDLQGVNNQLSNNAILCIHQDQYGLMWLGTYDGLNLYDGKKVTTFRYEISNPGSIAGNTIHNIQDADLGYIWVATQRGLNKFSLKERKVVESYPEYKRVDFITTDNNGNSWIFNKNNLLLFYDASLKKMIHIHSKEIELENIKSVFTDKNGRICLLKKNAKLQHLYLVKSSSEEKDTPYTLKISETTIHNQQIIQVFYEDEQIYFIDEHHNLFVFDSYKQMKILLHNISDMVSKYGIISSLKFFKNQVYLAFMHSGLLKFDASTPEKKIELIDMSVGIFCMTKDKFQEMMWIGTDGLGVEMYCSERNNYSNILLNNLPFPSKRPVRAIYTDEHNTLWIGTKGNGIIKIKDYDNYKNREIPSQNIQRIPIAHENPVYSFIRSKYNKDDLWIGTDGNLSYYSYKTNRLHIVKDNSPEAPLIANVHSFREVNDSTIWLSARGLCKIIIDKRKHPYEIKRKESYNFYANNTIVNDEFYSMIYDGDSILFLGSRGGYGINRFNIKESTGSFLLAKQSFAIGDVISLYIDKKSTIYVGTSSGLIRMNEGKTSKENIKLFTREDGILNDMIHGILEDNYGIIWMSTNKGLVKYNPKTDAFFNVKSAHIGVSEFSDDAYWKCPITDRLFFGGVNGLTWIEPDDEPLTSTYVPSLLFTELECADEKSTLYQYNEDNQKTLRLSSEENTFQIAFTVLDYINGENYDYFYLLENYNDQWIGLKKENKIQFTNIPSGNYTLKIKYRNDVVSADNKVYTLKIKVLPPWYLSLWAYIIYCLLLVASSILIVYYLRRKLVQKHQELALRIKEEQKEKMYKSKLNFFTNITHELFTPLTLIDGAVEQIEKGELNRNSQKYIHILKNNIVSLNELIKEILEVRKIEEENYSTGTIKKHNIYATMETLLASFSVIAKRNNITLETAIPENLHWNTDNKGFSKIISNLVSNAMKYTPVGGVVRITMEVENDTLRITVFNTGKGIEPDKISSVFNRHLILENTDVNANNQMTARNGLGLYICHSTVKMLKGEITVDSRVNEYTEFTVTLPQLIVQEEATADSSDSAQTAIPKETTDKQKFSSITVEETVIPLILIVDDNREIVELLGDILAPTYRVLKALSANEALSMITEQTPSLIITDIMMPVIDGFTFIQILRKDKYCKRLPIIALSALTDNIDLAKGYDTGADAYLTKPFSSEVLLSVVSRLLANKVELKNYYETADSSFEYISGKLLHQNDKKIVEEILAILKENVSNPKLSSSLLAERMKMSPRNLYNLLRRILEMSPSELIKDYKFSYAAKLLLTTNLSIKEIIYKIGLSNKSYFYNEFFKKFQLSPKQYKMQERGEEVLDDNEL